MSLSNTKQFRAERHDFHAQAAPLSAVGLNRLHLTDVEPFFPSVSPNEVTKMT